MLPQQQTCLATCAMYTTIPDEENFGKENKKILPIYLPTYLTVYSSHESHRSQPAQLVPSTRCNQNKNQTGPKTINAPHNPENYNSDPTSYPSTSMLLGPDSWQSRMSSNTSSNTTFNSRATLARFQSPRVRHTLSMRAE